MRTFLSVLVLLVSVPVVLAMFDTISMEISQEDKFAIVWAFEFDKGGTMEMHASVDGKHIASNSTIQLLVCSETDLESVRLMRFDEICSERPFESGDCKNFQVGGEFEREVQETLTMESSDWFYLLQLNCDGEAYQLSASIVAQNLNGYLSLSEAPFVTTSTCVTAIWSIIALVWAVHFLRYWPFNIRLHALYLVLPICFALVSLIRLGFWKQSQATGYKPVTVLWASFAIAVVVKIFMFGLLMVTAKGWSLIRKRLPHEDVRQIAGLTLAVAMSYAFFLVLGGIALFVLVLMYVTAMRYVFASVGHILMEIEEQSDLLRSAGVDPVATPLDVKREIFKNFHVIILAYVATSVIFLLWSSIFLMRLPWLADLIEHGFDMALFISITYIIRMRPFRPYFVFAPTSRRQYLAARSESSSIPLVRDMQSVDMHLESGRPYQRCVWRPGMPVPLMCSEYDYSPWLHPYADPVMLVENPRQTGDAGDRVAVARQLL